METFYKVTKSNFATNISLMDKDYSTHYIALRKAVEERAGREMKTPNDFVWLMKRLQSQLKQAPSLATLERFWGYAKTPYQPSRWTLNVLSAYVGSKDFEHFCRDGDKEVQSDFLDREQLSTDSLARGARLQLTWSPGRRCVIEYLGNGYFRILEAVATKLSKGDTFMCHSFIQNEPLYLSILRHEGLPPVAYVAGKKEGVRFAEL